MKTERIYREILYRRLQKDETSFTQRDLASSCSVSLGLVNYGLGPLRRMGAVEIRRQSLLILDPWKILMYWCAVRDFGKVLVYSKLLAWPVHRIETSLPHDSLPTAYTAYREMFGDPPADYSEVFAYGDKEAFVERFGAEGKEGRKNLFVLKMDEHLASLGSVPLAQVYTDLWNIETWYARRFIDALNERLKKMLPGGVP